MKRLRVNALWLATLVMELSCLGAWATLTLNLIDGTDYPLRPMFVAFTSASLAGTLLRRAAASLATSLCVHSILCVAALILVLQARADLTVPIWDLSSQWRTLTTQRGASAWLAMFASVCWAVGGVAGGVRHALRSRSYLETCRRFDRGLLWLLALLFLKLVVRGQTEVPLSEGIAEALVAPFLGSGLLAIGLARAHSGSAVERFTSQPQLLAAVAFSALIAVLALGTTVLFLPALQVVSRHAQRALEPGVEPAARLAVQLVLRVLAALRAPPPQRKDPELLGAVSARLAEAEPPAGEAPWETDTLSAWLWALLACAVVVWLGRRFRRRRPHSRASHLSIQHLCRWWVRLVQRLRTRLARWRARRREHEALRLYRALVRQGRRHGVPRRASETPLEYGRRLSEELTLSDPEIEIEIVVASFNEFVYGGVSPAQERLRRARHALRRLWHPRLLASALIRKGTS